ncbi:hypothetical protein D3C87_915540 [compost metagenome]
MTYNHLCSFQLESCINLVISDRLSHTTTVYRLAGIIERSRTSAAENFPETAKPDCRLYLVIFEVTFCRHHGYRAFPKVERGRDSLRVSRQSFMHSAVMRIVDLDCPHFGMPVAETVKLHRHFCLTLPFPDLHGRCPFAICLI